MFLIDGMQRYVRHNDQHQPDGSFHHGTISADPTKIRLHSLEDSNSGKSFDFSESLKFMVGRGRELEQLAALSQQVYGPVTLVVLDFLLLEPFSKLPLVQTTPVAALWTSSAAMLHVVVNAGTLVEKGYLPRSIENGRKTVDSSTLPGTPCELSVFEDLPDDPLDPNFKVMCGMRQWLAAAGSLLVNTFEELDKDLLSALQLQGFNKLIPVGPLLSLEPNTTTEATAHVFYWLDKQPASQVLYVSFGTMLDLQLEQLEEIAHALENSRQPFLWVVNGRTQKQVEVGKLLDVLKSRTGERGMVVEWSPQFQVLRHPSVGGFVTHCGWNSTLESIVAGVPMIAWAMVGDQFINSKYVVEVWKVGVRIKVRSLDGSLRLVSRDEIEASIGEVMNSTAMHERANQLSVKGGEVVRKSHEMKLRDVFNTTKHMSHV